MSMYNSKAKKNGYVNLMSGKGFHRIFGWRNPAPWLIDFANEVIDSKVVLQNGRYESGDTFIFNPRSIKRLDYDILCKADPKTLILMERANYKDKKFEQRATKRISTVVGNCNLFGEHPDYSNFININIVNFTLQKKSPAYIHYFDLYYEKGIKNDVLKIIIELPKFNKGLEALETEQDKWLYLFKNLHNLNKRPSQFDSDVFKRLFEDPLLQW
ncbi:hypothetical protein GCM10027566_23650 [Arachidicoccus ginsenosidivorans]|uniref:Uncharacterized protein n=2 Tax=Arachidicoccus ginsenosidivorans TaxID=496057 RepID=A0A5B8VI89_9BACT|nr:hypothetical protein FSB73_06000 [Arachidicoccus ginsenosidivorans]